MHKSIWLDKLPSITVIKLTGYGCEVYSNNDGFTLNEIAGYVRQSMAKKFSDHNYFLANGSFRISLEKTSQPEVMEVYIGCDT